MITFTQYLDEAKSVFTKPVRQTSEEFIEWCETNASEYLKQASKFPIYRGMKNNTICSIIDTSGFNRISANTNNIYTLWIDNYSGWKKYPRRSKSLICSTSNSNASGYGKLNLVIPSDSCKIGVCPDEDIWNSFDKRLKRISFDLDRFVSSIAKVLSAEFPNVPENGPTDWETLSSLLKKFSLSAMESSDDVWFVPNIVDLCKKQNLKNMYEAMVFILDPEANNFSTVTPGNFSAKGNTEVWIQGECAIINSDFMPPKDKLLSEFLKTRIPTALGL